MAEGPATVELVTATRLSRSDFDAQPLGRTLRRFGFDTRIAVGVSADNSEGLPTIYNRAIDADGPDIIVFVHDDVWIEDLFLADRLEEGLARFDVVGIAGNRRRVGRQLKFYTVPGGEDRLDFGYTSGRLGIGMPGGRVLDLGPSPAACELLDGLFIATRRSTLRRAGVRFDPRFDFHFYDMDFCRTARQAGLSLGTWPIVLTHRSWGDYGVRWAQASGRYLDKWGD